MDARVVPVLLGVLALAVLAVPAAGTPSCSTVDGQKVCITDVSVSAEELSPDESGEVSVTIRNEGNQTTKFRVQLVVASPDNETTALELDRPEADRTLDPGESVTFTQPIDPETVGTHALQFRLVTPDRQSRFDATDPVTIQVTEPDVGLGGRIDRTELALGALIGALVVMGYLAFGRE